MTRVAPTLRRVYRRRVMPHVLMLVLAVLATATATSAVLIAMTGFSLALIIAVCITATACVVLAMAFRSTLLNGLEAPVAESIFVLVVYGIRPIFDLLEPRQHWVGTDVTAFYTRAMVGTVLFYACYLLAYFVTRPPAAVFDLPLKTSEHELTALRRISVALALIGLIGLAATIQLAGGLGAYLGGRTAQGQVNSVSAVEYLITLGVVAGAIRIGLIFVDQPHRARDLVTGVLMAAPVSLVTVAEGSRRYVLPLLAAVTITAFLLMRRKVPVVRMVLAAALAVFLLIPQENIRPGGFQEGQSYTAAVADGLADPGSLYADLFSSQSTSMVSAFALGIGDAQQLATTPGYGVFTLSETVLQPVPQQVWPAKPDTIRNQLIGYRFGLDLSGCLSLCPTYGPMMTGYADLGLIGTTLLGLLVGAFSGGWSRWTLRRGDLSGRLAYALSVWGFVFMWWSNLGTLTLQIISFGIPPLLARIGRR